MKPEKVNEYLENYQENVARCEFLRHEIAELQKLSAYLKKYQINDMVSLSQAMTGMPHGTAISDPTGKLGVLLAEGYETDFVRQVEKEIAEKAKELNEKRSYVIFVNAWLKVLTDRERFIVTKKILEKAFWRNIIYMFQHEFGEIYSRNGLKNIKDKAMEKIYKVAE